jgi:hypothetical protein
MAWIDNQEVLHYLSSAFIQVFGNPQQARVSAYLHQQPLKGWKTPEHFCIRPGQTMP